MTDTQDWKVASHGERVTMTLHGRFDFNRYADFRDLSQQMLAVPTGRELVIDLAGVDYLDSSALGMLLNLNDSAQVGGKRVVLANAHGMARQILDIAHFETMFEMR